jgi:hypothetical protein
VSRSSIAGSYGDEPGILRTRVLPVVPASLASNPRRYRTCIHRTTSANVRSAAPAACLRQNARDGAYIPPRVEASERGRAPYEQV